MKRKQPPCPEPVNECPRCTTPTRCRRIGDGKRGPHCVGKEDGPDDCDCLIWCGDDPWLAKGKAKPCANAIELKAQACQRRADLLKAATYLSPPGGDCASMTGAEADRIAGVLRRMAGEA